MKISERYTLEIGNIQRLIDDLKAGLVYEKNQTPGLPNCSTLGNQLEQQFSALIRKLDGEAPGDIEIAAHILEN